MIRILFADDEPAARAELKEALSRERPDWYVAFATGGREALEKLQAERFDVVASDLRMFGMDGSELLRNVQERHPRAVRIIFSAPADRAAARRIVHMAHQFVVKPCEVKTLVEVIERSYNLGSLLVDENLRGMVAQIGQLPAVPSVVAELNEVLAWPSSSLSDVAAVVEGDPALCAKLLQLVNSSFFGLAQRMTSVGRAVSYLGTDVLKSLAMTIEVFEFAKDHPAIPGFSIETERLRALRTAQIARQIGTGRGVDEEAFIAGILHDVGRLILAQRVPDRFAGILETARRTGRPSFLLEEEAFGVTHAEIGAYLLGLWGLPFSIVEAIAFHHRPGRVSQSRLDLLGVVHVAAGLASELERHTEGSQAERGLLDEQYLVAIGLADELPNLRRRASRLLEMRETGM
jgi:HD-like signal output (HDOD) protein/CheY-like chemotaxis protein